MKTIDATQKATDEVIGEVRRHKREIAEEHGLDVAALGTALQQREAGDPRFVMPQIKKANKTWEDKRRGG